VLSVGQSDETSVCLCVYTTTVGKVSNFVFTRKHVNLCLLKRQQRDASTASTKYPSVGAGKTRTVFSSGTTDSTHTVFRTPWTEDNIWTSSFANSSSTPSTRDNQKLFIRGGISEIMFRNPLGNQPVIRSQLLSRRPGQLCHLRKGTPHKL
jgi:hypothetical protein